MVYREYGILGLNKHKANSGRGGYGCPGCFETGFRNKKEEAP